MIEGNLLNEIIDDIEKCEEGLKKKEGLKKLNNLLIVKYSVIFADFEKNIEIDENFTFDEYEYNIDKLENIKDKLRGYLIKNSNDKISRLKIKIIKDLKKIKKIDDLSDEEIESFYYDIIGYYHGLIRGFGKNLYGYNDKNDNFIMRDILGIDSYKENLKIISHKLKAFYDLDCENISLDEFKPFIQTTILNENNNVNTEIRIDSVYEKAMDTIQDITSLSYKQIEEIEKKLLELRRVIESKDRKRNKWEKAKGIFVFAMDKGIDVALAFLPMMNFIK